ncbi:hypothetical protein BDY19DRAFT_997221 [Irpex rosettiformis]|uniref:Uncharacterized protein n=1 Tax=Irpex rosettiformis TaxID=378272 RepID=A0ACB8TST0_9APHY|nr:hypothetical protein BDY19DRAFT_997221 [Irpex rosettiformis]
MVAIPSPYFRTLPYPTNIEALIKNTSRGRSTSKTIMSRIRHITHSGRPPIKEDDIHDAQRDIEDELTYSVSAIYRHQTSKHGVYVGAPGMLLMEWTIADVVRTLRDTHGDSIIPPKTSLYSWFPFQKPTSGGRTGFLETDVGAATLILISDLKEGLLDVKGGTDRSRASAILLREAIQVAVDGNDPKDDDGCEVLYGRAGLLYGLLLVREATRARRVEMHDKERALDAFLDIVEQLCHEQNIAALINEIVARGLRGAKLYSSEARPRDQQTIHAPALMWTWHGKRYLGGAHGIAGILQMLVSAPSYMLLRHWDAILHTLQWLADIQDQETGSWSHKASRDLLIKPLKVSSSDGDNNMMVQWCHGAPGVLILFSKLLRQESTYGLELPSSLCNTMRDALARGAELVYARGLLRKGIGLCHGVAGSVYTLLAVSDILDSPQLAVQSGQSEPRPIRATKSKSQQKQQHYESFDSQKVYWFLRALHLAHLATSYRKLTQQGEMRSPDRPVSLYEGLAGMCCAWAEVMRRLEELETLARSTSSTQGDGERHQQETRRRGMPGYDDLP